MAHDPITVLSELMKLWPKQEDRRKEEEVLAKLGDFITKDVSETDLSIRPYGEFSAFSKPMIADGVAKVIVYDDGFTGDPGTLAVLVVDFDNQWRMKLFVELCLACFGFQLLADDIPCECCGATGWGEWKMWRERFGDKW